MLSLMLCLAHLLVVRHPNQVSHAYFGKGMLHCHIIGSGFIHLNIPLLLFIIYYYYIFVCIFMYNKKLFISIEREKGAGCAGRNAHERFPPPLSLSRGLDEIWTRWGSGPGFDEEFGHSSGWRAL